MAGDYIRRLSLAELAEVGKPFLLAADALPEVAFDSHPGLVENVLACAQERVKLLSELPEKVANRIAATLSDNVVPMKQEPGAVA